MKYHYTHTEIAGKKILLILVEFMFLTVFQSWRYKQYLLNKHGGDMIAVGYKDDDGEYIFDSEVAILLTQEELDALDWKEDEITSLEQ